MQSNLKVGDIAYTTASGFDLGDHEVTLQASYICSDSKGDEAVMWVVKYEYKGGTYYNMTYDEYLTKDDKEFKRLARKQELRDQIELLRQELGSLK